MQLRQLEYVAAIVRWKTMRRAAQELYVSEATMSQQLRTLEKELGFPLFERGQRRLSLTSAGETLLPDLHTLLQAKGFFEQKVAEIKSPGTGSLRLGITPGLSSLLLPAIFKNFKRCFQHIALDVAESGTYTIAEQLGQHLIDVGIFALSELIPFDLRELTVQRLNRTELVAVASQHHILARKENISRRQLEHQAIVDYSEKTIVRALLHAVLGPQAEANIVCSANNLEAVLSLTHAGTGITFLPRCIVEAEQMAAKFADFSVLRLAPELQFPLQYVCAYDQRYARSEHTKVLAEVVGNCFLSL